MRTVVITGGAAGLGRGIAQRLREDAWRVVLLDLNADAVAATAKELACEGTVGDVTDPATLSEAFDNIVERFGEIHGLVNSAGLTRTGPSAELSTPDWRLVIDVDLSGTFYACQAAVRHMRQGASIVNLASIAGVRALPGRAAYSAAKAGVVGLTKVLGVEWAPLGIRVNAVGPAWADTELLRGMIGKGALSEQGVVDKIPMGRLCAVDDVASATAFLLSDRDSPYITGQTLYIDGGYTWAG
jgi:NAD(P)-dependent dehydrogenase (short-subunit alcohol dehydrogenase family)